MKLSVHTFLTLDGVMQGPGGAEEDPSNGFERGGWLVPFADEIMGEVVDSWFERASAILIGHTTYTTMQAYWSQVTDPDNLVATVLNSGPKYVASTTMTAATWDDTTVLGGDVIAAVAHLKKTPGDGEVQVDGSAQLATARRTAGLVDEYRLITFPVTVGNGKRLFAADAPPVGFTVLDTRVTNTGAVYIALTPQDFAAGVFTDTDGKEPVYPPPRSSPSVAAGAHIAPPATCLPGRPSVRGQATNGSPQEGPSTVTSSPEGLMRIERSSRLVEVPVPDGAVNATQASPCQWVGQAVGVRTRSRRSSMSPGLISRRARPGAGSGDWP